MKLTEAPGGKLAFRQALLLISPYGDSRPSSRSAADARWVHCGLVKETNTRAQKQLRTLFTNAGIHKNQPSDFTLGVFDEDYNLIATGSAHENHLHSLAADRPYRGNQELYLKANHELAPIFNSLGFFEIASLGEEIYMGNQKAINRETIIQPPEHSIT